MAVLFMAFVVVVVISRVKAKRKAERKKRRQEMKDKKERREKRMAARAARERITDSLGPAEGEDARRGSAATGSTNGGRRRARENGYESASSSTDSEHDDANSSRRPSGSGTTSTTVRLAKQRALVAAVEDSIVPPSRAGRAKKRFGWTSAVNMTGVGNGAVSGARLGDPRRVWGWKKGLRRRRGGAREDEQEESRSRSRSRPRSEHLNDVPGAAPIEEEQSNSVAQAASPVASLDAETSPLALRSPALHSIHELGERQSGLVEPSVANALPASSEPTEEATQRPQASAFPPAYYRAPPGDAGPSLPNDDETTTNGRITEAGPSARAMEKRPMPGVGYDDYFPAPTTEEQEEAVNIAYNRNVASNAFAGDSSVGSGSHPADGEHSTAAMPVPTGAGGHVATDDKQVLERLRLAGSAPPPMDGDAAAPDAHQAPVTESANQPILHASAPELQVDEDGFERMDDLLPPSEMEEDTVTTSSDVAAYTGGLNTNILPLPPAPVAQRSLAYARPSSPPRVSSSPVIASAPSAPHQEDPSLGLEGAQPSAPPLDIDSFDNAQPEAQTQPEPSAPGPESAQHDHQAAEDGDEGTSSRRFTVPHRTLGIDLPADLAAPPAFPHPEGPVSSVGAAVNAISNAGAPRYLPRYEP